MGLMLHVSSTWFVYKHDSTRLKHIVMVTKIEQYPLKFTQNGKNAQLTFTYKTSGGLFVRDDAEL